MHIADAKLERRRIVGLDGYFAVITFNPLEICGLKLADERLSLLKINFIQIKYFFLTKEILTHFDLILFVRLLPEGSELDGCKEERAIAILA